MKTIFKFDEKSLSYPNEDKMFKEKNIHMFGLSYCPYLSAAKKKKKIT